MNDQVEPELAGMGSQLCAALDEVLFGKADLTRTVVASLLAGGHALLEGLPGLGKTVLAKSLATTTGLDHRRIQFTPDLMPTDITGTHVFEDGPSGSHMRFVPGPVFTHFLLADEINRASPKTQAALLEAMAEGSVTLLGETRRLEPPFFVIATQNPIEMEGTNPLPEAQLDRFAVKIDVAPTNEDALLRMLRERNDGNPPPAQPLLDRAGLLRCQALVDEVFTPEAVAVLIAKLVAISAPSHPDAPEEVRTHVRYGASPRAAIWLARIARALAFIDGRPGVAFEDVAAAVPHVLGHRLILSHSARLDGIRAADLATRLHTHVEQTVLDAAGSRRRSPEQSRA